MNLKNTRRRGTRGRGCFEVLEPRRLLAGNVGGGHLGSASNTEHWAKIPNVAPDTETREFGRSLASLGDVDGDGVSDVAVGGIGGALILMLNSDGTVKSHQLLPAEPGIGLSVTSLGDLDGDGVPDLAVGDPQNSSYGMYRGAVQILLLNPDATVKSTTTIASGVNGGPDLENGDAFGFYISSVGDFDGDGVHELVVDAQGDTREGTQGVLYVLFMNRDGTVRTSHRITSAGGDSDLLQENAVSGLASIGDLDRDGVPDIAVGTRADERNTGAVYVLTMNSDGSVKSSTKIASEANGGPMLGLSDNFGSAVAAVDDRDGDGISELVVGASFDSSDVLGGGAIYTLFLNSDGTVKRSQKIASRMGGGPSLKELDGFGGAVVDVGDLNNDGTRDLIVGAPQDDTASRSRGAVYVLFMKPDGTVDHFHKLASDTNTGPSLGPTQFFGSAVASIGDLDGDGIEDLAVGAEFDDSLWPDQGAVFVLLMNADGTVKRSQKISSDTGGGPTLDLGYDRFGSSVAAMGDWDGDGIQDLAVGAEDDDIGIGDNRLGAVYLLLMNRDGTARESIRIPTETGEGVPLEIGALFGSSVTVVGDLDDDGVADLAVGGPQTNLRGALYILFMNSDGTVRSFEKTDATSPQRGFGSAVSPLGDFDGDGVEDLAVGANRENGLRGAVYLLMLNSDGTVKSSHRIGGGTEGSPTPRILDEFGHSIANMGDIDGDGVTDLAIGAQNDRLGDRARGAVYLVLMNRDGTVKRYGKVSDGVGGAPPFEQGERFGVSLGVTDLNKNGMTDLVVGATSPDAVYIYFDVGAPPVYVPEFEPTATGFRATFSGELNADPLNVSRLASLADVVVVGATSGEVQGSLDIETRTITFVKTGGPLVPDEYTVTLRSGTDAFSSSDATLLDGDHDGVVGGDFVTSFTVDASASNIAALGVPDVVVGPGDSTELPLSIRNAAGIRTIDLQISYDPDLLEITAASAGEDMPAGATFELSVESPGTAVLSLVSPVDLPAGVNAIITLQTEVPQSAASGTQGIIDVHSIIAEDEHDTQLPVLDDDALHVVALLGDVSGDGRVTASDASLVARVATLLESGFTATKLADPVLMGDVSKNGRLNAFDASLVARIAAGLGFANALGRSAPNSVVLSATEQVGVAEAPVLIPRNAARMDWHRAAVDGLLSNSTALWGTGSDEANVVGLGDGLTEILSVLT